MTFSDSTFFTWIFTGTPPHGRPQYQSTVPLGMRHVNSFMIFRTTSKSAEVNGGPEPRRIRSTCASLPGGATGSGHRHEPRGRAGSWRKALWSSWLPLVCDAGRESRLTSRITDQCGGAVPHGGDDLRGDGELS